MSRTSNGKTTILSNCAICGSKKSKFIKKQEANGLLSSLGIKTPLSKILFLGNVLFYFKTVLSNDLIVPIIII